MHLICLIPYHLHGVKKTINLRDTPFLFRGKGVGEFPKTIPTQQKLLKEKIVQGKLLNREKIKQVLSTFLIQIFDVKKLLHKLLPTKQYHAPENCPASITVLPPLQKNNGLSLGLIFIFFRGSLKR